MKKDLTEGLLPLDGKISFGMIRKRPRGAGLCAKWKTITEVAGHGPFGNGMKHWSTIRTGIETGLAADTSLFIRYDRIGFGDALPGTGRTDFHAGRLFAVLTNRGHEDRNLFPLFHPYP